MFVDASAIVAILTGEDEAELLAAALDRSEASMTSPIAVWEAAASISRKTGGKAAAELPDIVEFLAIAGTTIEPVAMPETAAALDAFDHYGRRSGHPADLNTGDCFAYAFAATRRIALLYKGKDFAETDLGHIAAKF